jgi:hypothetical protein
MRERTVLLGYPKGDAVDAIIHQTVGRSVIAGGDHHNELEGPKMINRDEYTQLQDYKIILYGEVAMPRNDE